MVARLEKETEMIKLLYPKYVLTMIAISLLTFMGLTVINQTGQILEYEVFTKPGEQSK